MYICNECGAVFDDPKTYYEHHPYGMGYAEEKWLVCPYCYGDFQEAEQCEECGEYVAELEDGLCDICHSDMCD